jgi:glucose/arabinose dehydrogenase
VAAGLLLWLARHPGLLERMLGRPLGGDGSTGGPLVPRFEGNDSQRRQIHIGLEKIAEGISEPTDIQFPPGQEGYAVVLEKTGTARWLKLRSGTHGELFNVTVVTNVEEGLLGLAFHPAFADNGRFFINYVTRADGKDISRVAEWRLSPTDDLAHARAAPVRILLEVEQPYANHDGGQLTFGPDGYLYIGWGDGGSSFDPHGNGQNPQTFLGSILRIDVNGRDPGKPYRVPPDNPFVGRPGYRPEVWAYGVRNPWRYSFDPAGRLIVADVGQNTWEEIDIVQAGDNLGWSLKEGFACLRTDPVACRRAGLVDPIYAYGRADGSCITGGYVYAGTRIASLRGLYVFGDFGSGRLFALELPKDRSVRVNQPIALGQWPLSPSTFGRDAHGEIYVASFSGGEIYRLSPAGKAR